MKHLKDQIKFIDTKLLSIYGFKNLLDYSHIINITDTDDLLIDLVKLNELIGEFRKIFHSKNFSLHKTQYKILTKSQAICLLKTCLEITSIPHDISLKKNKKYLRLISKNNILDNYINSLKMTENRTFETKNITSRGIKTENLYYTSSVLDPKISMFGIKERMPFEVITKKQLNDRIKKIHKYEFILNPRKLLITLNDEECNVQHVNIHNMFTINLKHYGLEDKILKSLKIEFITKKINSHPIISEHYISHLTDKINYIMVIGEQIIWESKCTASNCILDNVLIPTNCLKGPGQEIYLQIINIEELLSVIDNLEIKVNIEYVDLYAELDKKIQSMILEQEICVNDKYNVFRIMLGTSGMRFSKYLTKDEYVKRYKIKNNIDVEPPDDDDLNNLLVENIGKNISIFGIDGCIVQYDKKLFKLNINDFFKLNDKINFLSYDKTYKIKKELSYHKIISNDVFIHNYLINLNTNDNLKLDLDMLPKLISKLEIGISKINVQDIIEFSFKYRNWNIKNKTFIFESLEQNEFSFNENININDITNYVKINLNKFIPFGTKTYIFLTIKTNAPDEPIGDEIFVMTREHIFNSNQSNTIKIIN